MKPEKSIVLFLKVLSGTLAFLAVYFILTGSAWSASPSELLEGKLTVQEGACMMKKDGTLVSDISELAYIRDCAVGIDPNSLDKRYIATYSKDGRIESIIEDDVPTQTQKVIWQKGQLDI